MVRTGRNVQFIGRGAVPNAPRRHPDRGTLRNGPPPPREREQPLWSLRRIICMVLRQNLNTDAMKEQNNTTCDPCERDFEHKIEELVREGEAPSRAARDKTEEEVKAAFGARHDAGRTPGQSAGNSSGTDSETASTHASANTSEQAGSSSANASGNAATNTSAKTPESGDTSAQSTENYAANISGQSAGSSAYTSGKTDAANEPATNGTSSGSGNSGMPQ